MELKGNSIERKLQEALAYADEIFHTVRSPLLVLDSSLRVKMANRAFYETFRLSPSEIENRVFFDLCEGHWNIPGLRKQLEEIIPEKNEFENLEVEHLFPMIGRRTVLLHARQIYRDETGTGTLLLTIEDISDRKQAQKELNRRATDLSRSNAELERFAYVASHDLQEPLRIIASYTQLLSRRYHDRLDADGREFMRYIVDGAVRMQQLINDLLSYSRVSTQGDAFQETDCETVLHRAVENLKVSIEETGATVTHDPLPMIPADGSQIGQLFQNLIGNAIKFHGAAPPQIHLSAQERPREWLFSIQDNGIGLDPEYKERIFILFQRLHGRGEYPGTGIGLAICRKIVERHGGIIWVESTPNQGATFYFTLAKKGEPVR
ncbi:MAG: PAS domain S-box protein [Candidatus Manganitrophaceae bacterium]|nr:MAG: PAS domain S-box protein [Candidatus Manganitrophaceae bacterium]